MVDAILLIELVKERPSLYNNTRLTKQQAEALWQEIGNIMRLQASDCKFKWMTLKRTYHRHLKNMEANKSIPEGSKDYKSPWYLADRIEFLRVYKKMERDKAPQIIDTTSPCIDSESSFATQPTIEDKVENYQIKDDQESIVTIEKRIAFLREFKKMESGKAEINDTTNPCVDSESSFATQPTIEAKVGNYQIKDDQESIVTIETSTGSDVSVGNTEKPSEKPLSTEYCQIDLLSDDENFPDFSEVDNESKKRKISVIERESSELEESEKAISKWVQTARENLNMVEGTPTDEQYSNMMTFKRANTQHNTLNTSVTKQNEIPKLDSRLSFSNISTSDVDSTVKFFSGILPDIKKLSERGLRLFKQEIISSLNQLLDDQEDEFS